MSQSTRKKNCVLCKAAGHSIRTCGKAKELYGKDSRKDGRAR